MQDKLPVGFVASNGSEWSYNAGVLSVVAHPKSDIYIDPACSIPGSTAQPRHDAVTLLTHAPQGDFQLYATVSVDFKDTFDAGVLIIKANEKTWAKLCFEYSPDCEPMVVSVVNKGNTSDDANAFVVADAPIGLRISRKGNVYSFHASLDTKKWIFIRAFSFDDAEPNLPEDMQVGFEAQAPNGEGCNVEFSEILLTNTSLADLRDGQ